jgi:hypothetical protein
MEVAEFSETKVTYIPNFMASHHRKINLQSQTSNLSWLNITHNMLIYEDNVNILRSESPGGRGP